MAYWQGFMEGQRHVSDMTTAALNRRVTAAAESRAARAEPVLLATDKQALLEAQRLFRYNMQADPYRLGELRNKLAQLNMETDTMQRLRPAFLAQQGINIAAQTAEAQSKLFGLDAAQARTTQDWDNLLSAHNVPYKVVKSPDGKLGLVDKSGTQVLPFLNDAEFALHMGNPQALAELQVKYTMDMNLAQARNQQQPASPFAIPSTGFDAAPQQPTAAPGATLDMSRLFGAVPAPTATAPAPVPVPAPTATAPSAVKPAGAMGDVGKLPAGLGSRAGITQSDIDLLLGNTTPAAPQVYKPTWYAR